MVAKVERIKAATHEKTAWNVPLKILFSILAPIAGRQSHHLSEFQRWVEPAAGMR